MMALIITIDGPSAVGKTTLGQALAKHLGLPFWDSGLTFRALTLAHIGQGKAESEAALITRVEGLPYLSDTEIERRFLDGQDITADLFRADVTDRVAHIASDQPIREAVRRFHLRRAGPRLIIAGRDTGRAYFPDSDLAVELLASPSTRAKRRALQDSDGLVRSPPSEPGHMSPPDSIPPSRIVQITTDDLGPSEVFQIVTTALIDRNLSPS